MGKGVVVVGAAVLLGLAGCSGNVEVSTGGESASASPAVSEAPAGEIQTYTDDQFGFSFDYPAPFEQMDNATMEAQTDAGPAASAAVFDTKGTVVNGTYKDAFMVSVYELGATVDESNLEAAKAELESSVIPQLESSTQDMQISELRETEVGGLPGYTADATFTSDGTPMTTSLTWVFDGDVEYQLLAQSASDQWDSLIPAFEGMLDSFRVSGA